MKVAIILAVYFAIGGLGTAYAAARAAKEKRRAYWLKYIVYLLLTAALVTVIDEWTRALPFVVAALAVGGLHEILDGFRARGDRLYGVKPGASWRTHPLPLFALPTIIVYLACALLLLAFSIQAARGEAVTFLATYVLVVSFDGFSQISGQVIKSRKLMPRISPGKTVSGLIGGVAATVLTGAILFRPEAIWGACFGALIATSAFAGDTLASALKRRLGIKDFSNLIPGHGGILDRFDSMLMAGAVVEVVFYLAPSIR